MLYRAYKLSSSYELLHKEFEFLRNFFQNNGFPTNLIDTRIRKFLDKIYSTSTESSKSSDIVYLRLPYFGSQSEKLKVELSKLLKTFLPGITFNYVLVNPLKIGSFFNHKDRLPLCLRSSVIYHYRCACPDAPSYVGLTTRHFFERIAEHKGVSSRTGNELSSPIYSSIRDHSSKCGSEIIDCNFKLLKSSSSSNCEDLRILESLYIRKLRPSLNETLSSFPLQIA